MAEAPSKATTMRNTLMTVAKRTSRPSGASLPRPTMRAAPASPGRAIITQTAGWAARPKLCDEGAGQVGHGGGDGGKPEEPARAEFRPCEPERHEWQLRQGGEDEALDGRRKRRADGEHRGPRGGPQQAAPQWNRREGQAEEEEPQRHPVRREGGPHGGGWRTDGTGREADARGQGQQGGLPPVVPACGSREGGTCVCECDVHPAAPHAIRRSSRVSWSSTRESVGPSCTTSPAWRTSSRSVIRATSSRRWESAVSVAGHVDDGAKKGPGREIEAESRLVEQHHGWAVGEGEDDAQAGLCAPAEGVDPLGAGQLKSSRSLGHECCVQVG